MSTSSAANIRVVEFAFTGYPVTDLVRARGFYEGLLGLTPATIWTEGPGKAWIEYELGGHALAITNLAEGQWKPGGDGPALALEVADFDATVEALRAAGVVFVIDVVDSPTCRLAVILDPDGNSLAIHRRAGRDAHDHGVGEDVR
ncbi:MAG: VOC family protein [Verrucomicrobiota bacterium]